MALPTAPHAGPPTPMAHTQGVGQVGPQQPMTQPGASPGVVGQMRPQGGTVAQTPQTEPAKAVLFNDLDPVLLTRLYPNAKSSDEAKAEAKKAGQAAHDGAMTAVAAAQVDTQEVPPEGAAPQGPSTKDTIRELPEGLVSTAADQALKERGDPRAAMLTTAPAQPAHA